ncbi:MAG: hypothetical protein CBB92_11240 [Flammeovirgaceae bacterium TMED32]|nr:MAG: hypothetical protein CBB92_11240 [Flammeovirgaceae bacterium TMED32]
MTDLLQLLSGKSPAKFLQTAGIATTGCIQKTLVTGQQSKRLRFIRESPDLVAGTYQHRCHYRTSTQLVERKITHH